MIPRVGSFETLKGTFSALKDIQTTESVKGFRNSFHVTHLAESSFRERLAYARWLRTLRTGEAPTNVDLARAAGRSSAWATGIVSADRPPDSREVGRGLSDYLGVPELWLMDGRGAVPEPELWVRWQKERGKKAPPVIPTSKFKPAATSASKQSKKRGA